MKLQIMVTSRWSDSERRQTQRHAIKSCYESVLPESNIDLDLLFFMGDLTGTMQEQGEREIEHFGDLIVVGGPDNDPEVPRDATYVLDRPCARTYRLAHGTAWLMQHRPDLDFVVYLDDDSFLHVPRLVSHLTTHNSSSLAMGYLMETSLDWSDTHVCELCEPCEQCRRDVNIREFCANFPDMTLGGCLMAITNCQIFNEEEPLDTCVVGKKQANERLTNYFGSRSAPRWMLGMGWVFGHRIARFIGRNAHRLKVRGAADVSLGFWLAPLESVYFVPMDEGIFHDHPGTRSTFASACTGRSVLVHRMNPERWQQGFDAARCELTCEVHGEPS